MPEDPTLVDAWLHRLKNNRFIATIMVMAEVVGGMSSFFKELPDGVQTTIVSLWPFRDTRPQNGWAWAGYLDKNNPQRWAQGPYVEIVKKSAAADRPYPIRIGDTVTPTREINQVIVDYRDKKDDNVLVPPPRLRTVISPVADYTGLKFKPKELHTVADVVTVAFPGSDGVVWLRLIRDDIIVEAITTNMLQPLASAASLVHGRCVVRIAMERS